MHSAELNLRELHANRFVVFGISNSRRTAEQHAGTVAGFRRDVLPLIERGVFTPVIDRVVPLSDAIQACRDLEDRRFLGKIVVTP